VNRSEILIGVDLGTTKLCALAFEPRERRVLAMESVPNDAGTTAGNAEQDAGRILARGRECLSKLVARPELASRRVAGIGVTGQMHGVVLVDKEGRPQTALATWQDQSGNEPSRTGRSFVAELAHRLDNSAPTRIGCLPATGYGGVTLLKWQEEGRLVHGAMAMTIPDLFVRELTGVALTDPTLAASWGIFDAKAGQDWLPGLRKTLGWPEGLLPTVRPTGSRAGALSASARVGLAAGVPVAVAIGDNQAGFIGGVPSLDRSVLFNLGTGGQMSVAASQYRVVPGLETRPLAAGRWLLVGAALCGGQAFDVLARFFARTGQELFGVESKKELYEAMNRAAAAADDGLSFSPLFCGTRQDPDQRAAISGIGLDNFTPGNMTRALVRGMVDELVSFYRAAGVEASVAAGSGNGLRRNPAVQDELKRRLGMQLFLPEYQEEAAVGAALTAGVAAGVYPDWTAVWKR